MGYLIAGVVTEAAGELVHKGVEQRGLLHHHFLRLQCVLTAATLDTIRRKSPGSPYEPEEGRLAFCF